MRISGSDCSSPEDKSFWLKIRKYDGNTTGIRRNWQIERGEWSSGFTLEVVRSGYPAQVVLPGCTKVPGTHLGKTAL